MITGGKIHRPGKQTAAEKHLRNAAAAAAARGADHSRWEDRLGGQVGGTGHQLGKLVRAAASLSEPSDRHVSSIRRLISLQMSSDATSFHSEAVITLRTTRGQRAPSNATLKRERTSVSGGQRSEVRVTL